MFEHNGNQNWTFFNPVRLYFGVGQFDNLNEIADSLSAKKVLLVTGKNSMRKLGYTDRALEQLKDKEVVLFEKVEPNPSDKTIEAGVQLLKEENCDLVVALGGGSALDAAKAIAALTTNPVSVHNLLDENAQLTKPCIPWVGITTTAGTGSELTRFTVITDTSSGKPVKRSARSDYMYAKVAIVDPELTLSMPPYVTACTGLDALCQSMEAFWDKRSFILAQGFALEAINVIYHNLIPACENPNELRYRIAMSYAQTMGAYSFSNIGTNAMHSVSRVFTDSFGIAHGHACALTMVGFMRLLKPKHPHLLLPIAKAIGAKTADLAIEKMHNLLVSTGLKFSLKELGIKESDIPFIVDNAFRKNMDFFQIPPSREQIEQIIRNIL